MIDRMTDTTITEHDVLNKLKGRDRLLTALLWFVYLYLWMPLISVLAWYLGIDFAYEKVIKAGGIESLFDILIAFGLIVAVTLFIVMGWSLSQRWRFAGKDRRKSTPGITPDDEMAVWHIDEGLFDSIRHAKILTVHVDENERLTRVQSRRDPDADE